MREGELQDGEQMKGWSRREGAGRSPNTLQGGREQHRGALCTWGTDPQQQQQQRPPGDTSSGFGKKAVCRSWMARRKRPLSVRTVSAPWWGGGFKWVGG